jgi:threonine dehydrogenase-like Zn-dependent dehydrogenase
VPTTPEPSPTPTPIITENSTPKEAVAAISVLAAIDPQELTPAQAEQLVTAANVVLDSAPENSPEYAKALDALAVAAQADDPQVPEALANIPGVGQAAVAVLNAFNALGNFGADMSPAHRATAKKEVVAAIVLTQVTTAAIGAATSAATSTASSSGSAARRREGK